MTTPRPRVALTLGDPAGVGPELAARLLARPESLRAADVYVLAGAAELADAAHRAGVDVPLAATPSPTGAALLDDGSSAGVAIDVGVVSRAAGQRALHQLRRALALAGDGRVDAIVYAPLNKSSAHLAGMAEEDELRWFAGVLGVGGVTSELNVVDRLWTARVTSHISLAEVAPRITVERTVATIELLHRMLEGSGVPAPRLAVAALNPHAGENGRFGREEIDVIAPAVRAAVAAGIDARGPFPSDTVFLAARRGDVDGVVTMYHDQGQIAMKLLGFDRGVTVQGGLPVPVVTPAHGTAFDIAGRGVADPGATCHAFDLAVALAG
jgi:4-hydroxythreonine-4-phosphate dehydrogenase